jgi:ATP-dependent DNA helicase RecG
MTLAELKAQIARGEDSRRQFKQDIHNPDALAAELAAFSNSEGGVIFLGVADDGSLPGLTLPDVSRLNQMISNAASQHIRSPISVQTENLRLKNQRIVIVLTVPKGLDKPYFDRNGVIWLKSGADKRRVNSKEELRRLFQSVDQFHANQLPTKAGIDKLDKWRVRDFLRDVHKQSFPNSARERLRLLQNMNLATEEGVLNLAGVLLFAARPEWIKPQFIIKAVRYPGNTIHQTQYVDTEDFAGPLRKMFDGALSFINRNLHKIQAGQGVNSVGIPEIPLSVFEELLVNALAHRDYLITAPIRLFVFDNRIEIISPGHLPNNLTVAKIRTGNSVIRNPILFTATIRRRPDIMATEVTTEVTTEVEGVIRHLKQPMTRGELQLVLNLKNSEHFRKAYLQPALAAGAIEMMQPDKPTSSKQKYRLTPKGQRLAARWPRK